MSEPVLIVEGLRKHFVSRKGFPTPRTVTVRAVEDISFRIHAGEAFGLVGESGCGKSTAARALLRLIEPDAGRVTWKGEDVLAARGRQLKMLRRRMQIVFQDPYSSLDPRQSIGSALVEPMRVHGIAEGVEARRRAGALLEEVGLPPAALDRFPHEFSGGQRQRIGIARALALNPKFIVCDEPIAALDVSIQAQVVNLLEDLQDRLGLTYLFISHDLSMVRHIADRVAVMYLGRIAELSPRDALYARPLHPYAEALLSAVPEPDPNVESTRTRIILKGDVPSPANPPKGCNFNTRCPRVFDRCRIEKPDLVQVEPGRLVACHLYTATTNPVGSTGRPEVSEHNQQGVSL